MLNPGRATPADGPGLLRPVPFSDLRRLRLLLDRPDWQKLFTWSAAAYCATKIALMIFYSFHLRYNMDEYGHARFARFLTRAYDDFQPVKTVLATLFWYPAWLLSDDSIQFMELVRLTMLVPAAATIVSFWLVCRQLGYCKAAALFALAILLTFTNFLVRVIEARGDNFALFFMMAALLVVCRMKFSRLSTSALVGALMGLAFLSTQKAVYGAIATAVAMAVALLTSVGVRRFITAGLACFGSFGVTVIIYSLAFGGASFLRVAGTSITGPADMYRRSLEIYPHLRSVYLGQTWEQNWLVYLISAIGLAAALTRWRTLSVEARFAVVFCLTVAVLYLAHNQPWPYALIPAATFLPIWAAETYRRLTVRGGAVGWIASLALLAGAAVLLGRDVAILDRDNAEQKAVVAKAESLLGPSDRYQDGIGMLAKRQMAPEVWWDVMSITRLLGRLQKGDMTPVEQIVEARPKLWIITNRTIVVTRLIEPVISRSYVRVDRNILLTGSPVDHEGRIFTNLWPGRYALYGHQGEITDEPFLLDGVRTTGGVELGTGSYRLQAVERGAGPRALLPAGLPLDRVHPLADPPLNLFANVYD